jgi:hypothetical protein
VQDVGLKIVTRRQEQVKADPEKILFWGKKSSPPSERGLLIAYEFLFSAVYSKRLFFSFIAAIIQR